MIYIVLICAGFSCKKESLEEQTGLLKDYTGFDGCGYLIDLDNGSKLEPVRNLSGVAYEDNRRVSVRYRIKQAYSVCMAGQTVEIVSLRYL